MSITVDFVGTPLSGEEPLSVAFTSTVVSVSPGIRRRVRVRRSDFSSQEAYELALKAAASESGLAYLPEAEKKPERKQRKRVRSEPLSIENEIRMVEESERRRKAEEEQELAMVLKVVKMIEERV